MFWAATAALIMEADIDFNANPFPEPVEMEITDIARSSCIQPERCESRNEAYLEEACKKGFEL